MSNSLARLALSDDGFVFNPQTGDSFQVSETGLFVLRHLKEGMGTEEVAARLADLYDVSLEEAQRDCDDFRTRLKHFDLV